MCDIEARDINQVLRTFEKYGYDVTTDKAQAAYLLNFSITGGLAITVEISVLRASVAISGRVAEPLSELDDALARAEAAEKW